MQKKVKILILSIILIFIIISIWIYKVFFRIIIKKQVLTKEDYLLRIWNNKTKILIKNSNNIGNKIALALSINVGSYNDGKVIGITHILEHMFFNGSTNYSKEEFNKILNLYNAYFNAETNEKTTDYYFLFDEYGLEEIIKLIVDTINNLLLKPDEILKEISNVNSELKMRENQNEFNSFFKILKKVVNKNSNFLKDGYHIYNNNLLNLIIIKKKLMEIYEKFYNSKFMNFVIISRINSSKIYNKIYEHLNKIKNTKFINPKLIDYDLFNKDTYKNIYYYKYKNNYINKFLMVFTLDMSNLDFQNMMLFLQLFNLKEKFSLYYILKIKYNYILNYEVYTVDDNEKNSNFVFSYKITNKGFKNIKNIINLTMSYILYLSKLDLRYFIENYRKLSIINYILNLKLEHFDKLDKKWDVLDKAKEYAQSLHETTDINEIFNNDNYFKNLDLAEFKILCNSFNLNKVVYFIESSKFTTRIKKEKVIKSLNNLNTVNLEKKVNNRLSYTYNKIEEIKLKDLTYKFKINTYLNLEEISYEKCNTLKFYGNNNTEGKIEILKNNYEKCFIKPKLNYLDKLDFNIFLENENLKIYNKQIELSLKNISTLYIEFPEIFLKLKKFRKIYYFNLVKDFFCNYVKIYIDTYYYDYILNGFKFNCRNSDYYLIIEFRGIYRNLSTKIQTIFKFLKIEKIDNDIFKHVKISMIEDFNNVNNISNLKFSSIIFKKINKWLYHNIQTNNITNFLYNYKIEELKKFITDLKGNSKVSVFNIGHFYVEEKQAISNIYYDFFNNSKVYYQINLKKFNLTLEDKEYKMYRFLSNNHDDINNNYETCYFLNFLSKENLIYIKIIKKYWEKKAYYEFREKLNWGYVVDIKIRKINYQNYFCLIINGYKLRPIEIEPYVEKFLLKYFQKILNLKNLETIANVKKYIKPISSYSLSNINDYLIKKYILKKNFGQDLHNSQIKLLLGISRFKLFFKKKFIDAYKRITIEIFHKNLHLKEKFFQLKSFSKQYQKYKISKI